MHLYLAQPTFLAYPNHRTLAVFRDSPVLLQPTLLSPSAHFLARIALLQLADLNDTRDCKAFSSTV